MVRVYYSHLGEEELNNLEVDYEEYNFNGELIDLIKIINSKHPGLINLILKSNYSFQSSAKVYKNVLVDDERILDGDETVLIKKADEGIKNDDNLLISIYNPQRIANLFDSTLKNPIFNLEYKRHDSLESLPLESKSYLDHIEGPLEESIKSFERGECTLKELMVPFGESIEIKFKNEDFSRKESKIIPEPLINAIKKIWDLEDDSSNLYLHQEDCLFNIIGKLKNPSQISAKSLLLAIPTGGGKTEAFLIPIISHIYEKKSDYCNNTNFSHNKISSIITYPTKALANDQAERIIEILFELNKNTNPDQQVTLGVLTGDTPNRGGWELRTKSLVQICPNCKSSELEFLEDDSEYKKQFVKCKHCGNELRFTVLTREDMLKFPPDILITNLDMINYCLQSPNLRSLFKPDKLDLDLMVFDEVHLCESVFGCHTGHLLRRLEVTCGKKPLYMGVSATIGNAKDLAALIFNVPKNEILYLNEFDRPYLKNETSHYRYHYILTPYKYPERYAQVVTTALNTVDVLGHSIKDPHFRKTIIFSNYRQDTDNLVKYLRDQEDRYFKSYRDEIRHKLALKDDIYKMEQDIASSVGSWYEFLDEINILYNQSLEIGWHRGGLEQKERLRAVTRFSSSKRIGNTYFKELPVDIMMATNTLELGIDIGDVTNVFNCSAPFTVNEYVQRSGRGGRKYNSSTITVIDPTNPLDFYLKNNFKDYVLPENREFEDAPIIITNESIANAHILARILEFISDELMDSNKNFIKVEDLFNLEINYKGELVRFENNPEIIAEAIFERMFKEKTISDINNNDLNVLELYEDWYKLEHDLLDVEIVRTESKNIKEILMNKCIDLRDKIRSEELNPHDRLTGLKSAEKSLVPKMRGSGPVCNIKLIRDRGEEIKDNVNRRRVMTNMPPGGYATQGANTFKVDSIESDPETEKNIRNLLNDDPEAFNFFRKFFGEYFPNNVLDLDLNTPQDLKVRYYPFRFYCSQCGKTYTKPTDDDRCLECGLELRQLTEIFMCDNKDCGEIFEPPVPKVCLNPAHIKDEKKFIKSLNTPFGPRPKYEFEFRALPKLHWQCKKCKTTINFHQQQWGTTIPQSVLKLPLNERSFENPQGIAKHFQYRPESTIWTKEKYLNKGFNPTRNYCDKCNSNKPSIKAKNVPTVRCSSLEYIVDNNEFMEMRTSQIGQMRFKNVDVISLSREFTRRFYTKDSSEINSSEIFPGKPNSYYSNTFSTQATYLSLSSALIDEFIDNQQHCLNSDCNECTLLQNLPDNLITRPKLELEKWEIDKKPDLRIKWCKTAKDQGCERETCLECPDFVRRDYLKYLLIHVLKHSLILAMPKYIGVNKNEIRGIIRPNGKDKPELVFLDVHEDGSGSIYLMKRNWDKIWDLSENLIKNALNGQGSLLLPQFCERHNADICPVIGANFYEFVKKVSENGK